MSHNLTIGTPVKIKPGFHDKETEIDMSGWSGRVSEIDNNQILVEFDDQTIDSFPDEYVMHQMDNERDHNYYWIYYQALDTIRSTGGSTSENVSSFSEAKPVSRRKALGKVLAWSGGTILAGYLLYQCVSDEDDDVTVTEEDSVALQKKEGWNTGADDLQVAFNAPTEMDYMGMPSAQWNKYKNPDMLKKVYMPTNERFKKYSSASLYESLGQKTLQTQMKASANQITKTTFNKGLGVRQILLDAQNPEVNLVVVDLKGWESVAVGAALADVADLIPTFNNWPHPLGEVPAHETLATSLYYASYVEREKAKNTAKKRATVMLLDRNRFESEKDGKLKPIKEGNFDNRYNVDLPTVDELKSAGITNVVYITPSELEIEKDDINEEFATYREKGIQVALLPISRFEETKEQVATTNQNPNRTGQYATNYYYGGSPMGSMFFFYHYPMYRSYYRTSIPSGAYNRYASAPNYSPARRTTSFASRSVGGTGGFGKSRPTGFGKVTVNRSMATGKTVGFGSSFRSAYRSGGGTRSGSFGRSRGGGFFS